jgi:hypothetical protein
MVMIYVQANWFYKYPELPSSPQEAVVSFAEQLPSLFNEEVSSVKKGIYLATSDAGALSSVLFWENALEHRPKFANPINFPWTLANAPAGYFSRFYHIQGPNYTLVGGADALIATFDHAFQDLSADRVEQALVVALDFRENPQMGIFLLSKKVTKLILRYSSEGCDSQNIGLASDLAKSLCHAIETKKIITFGFPNEVAFELIKVA